MNKINFETKTQVYNGKSSKPSETKLKNNKYVDNSINSTDEFVSKTEPSSKKSNNFLKKYIPLILSGILTLAGISSCSEEKVSDTSNVDGMKIEYVNVSPETRDQIAAPLITLKSKLTPENDFLKGVDVNIARMYSDLDDSHSFKTFIKNDTDTENERGTSFYSDNNIKRIIVVQEGAHDTWGEKLLGMSAGDGSYSALPAMRHTLMHEVGHQFDEYFGHDHNAKFALQRDSIIGAKEKDPKSNPYSFSYTMKEKGPLDKYDLYGGLSDKKEFKKAFLEDLKHIASVMKNNPDHVACNIDYYAQGIDFNKPITMAIVQDAEDARCESYANLFAYAIGQNDGDKEDFVENFKNSYKVVQKDIQKYLNISSK